MRPFIFAAVLALAAAVLPRAAAAQPDPLRDRIAAHLEATQGGNPPTTAFPRLWNVMDSLVLRELGRGHAAAEVNRTLSALPGFAGASEGDGVTVGGGTFYSELPRELPGYVLLPVRTGGEPLLMGVYNFGMNGAGRISLFAQRAGRWRKTGVVDARFAVTPYPLPLADSGLAVVTLDVFTGGDHQDGTARAWRVRGGALEPIRTLAGEMKEPRAEAVDGRVRVAFTRFPRHLSTPVLGTRIAYVTTLSSSGTGVSASTEVANPWVEVVDRYFGLARHTPARARALLATPALAGLLGSREPVAHSDGGDPAAGTGWIVLEIGGRRARVTSRRHADGRWRIASVRPETAPEPDGRTVRFRAPSEGYP